jgi:hypothetical protein
MLWAGDNHPGNGECNREWKGIPVNEAVVPYGALAVPQSQYVAFFAPVVVKCRRLYHVSNNVGR